MNSQNSALYCVCVDSFHILPDYLLYFYLMDSLTLLVDKHGF